jgi:hypothetical protein
MLPPKLVILTWTAKFGIAVLPAFPGSISSGALNVQRTYVTDVVLPLTEQVGVPPICAIVAVPAAFAVKSLTLMVMAAAVLI